MRYRSSKVSTVVLYLVLFSFAVVFLLPLVSVFFTAFKTSSEFANSSALELPESFLNFENFKIAFTQGNMMTGFKNTSIIILFSLTISVLNSAMVAYILSRFVNKFTVFVQILFAGAVMLPGFLLQITTFQIVSGLGLFNTLSAPIFLYAGTDIVSVYIFLQFMDQIPKSLDEAAEIDGCGKFGTFFKVILPLVKPAIVTVTITKGIQIYNDFYIPFLYAPSSKYATISTSLFAFKGPFGSKWEIISAGIIIIMIPSLVIFLLLQKKIYNGIVGGVKE